MSVPNQQEYIL